MSIPKNLRTFKTNFEEADGLGISLPAENSNKYTIFKIRHVQTNELPRTLGQIFFSFGRIEGMKYWFLNFPILKVQKMDMEKREKAAKERNANIERSKEELVAKVTGTKRKSKWDQAGPLGAPQPPITSIPAFGALSKK